MTKVTSGISGNQKLRKLFSVIWVRTNATHASLNKRAYFLYLHQLEIRHIFTDSIYMAPGRRGRAWVRGCGQTSRAP